MPGSFLTTAAIVQCMHGGIATLATSNARLNATTPVLLETDLHLVAGCTFTPGGVYTPCMRIQWTAGVTAVKVNGAAPLVQTSIGQCLNAAGAPQGVAIVSSPGQMRASGR